MSEKDASEFRTFLQALSGQSWLRRQRREWPLHLYHFSDVRSIASILLSERIYSRNRAEQLGVHGVEIASPEIIEGSPWAHDRARLYFHPVTPTQFHNEGIRPPEQRSKHSHCPVPVFLVFHAPEMLARQNAQITDGNFARHRFKLGSGVEFLRTLNFRAIYHDSAYPADMARGERDEITRARCAEVVYPDEVDLAHLKEVVCRTPAERQTLLTLLGSAARRWSARVRVQYPGERLFFSDWTFVREVSLSEGRVNLLVRFGNGRYAPEALTRFPDGSSRPWAWDSNAAEGLRQLQLAIPEAAERVFVELTIAGCLAYQGYLSRRSLF
jgi:hypothetical protein